MLIKTKEQLISEMEATGILTSKEMTFIEYANNLTEFQQMILRMIMNEDYERDMRFDAAIFKLDSEARKKGLAQNPEVRKGISALRTVNREIAITLSGIRGENFVSRTLEFIERPEAKVYKNVYISNGKEETELDAVVVTNEGIIILEIKKAKDDLTITEDGRLLHSGDECYEKKSLGEKMELKRRLLKESLEKAFDARKESITVPIDSYIVFSPPKGTRINIKDCYQLEKWCFRTGINARINNYCGQVYYSEEQLEDINRVLSAMEVNKKRFQLSVDFDAIRSDFAGALCILSLASLKVNGIDTEKTTSKTNYERGNVRKYKAVSNKYDFARHAMYALQLAGGVAGALVMSSIATIASGSVFKK